LRQTLEVFAGVCNW